MSTANWVGACVLAGGLVWAVWAFNALVQARNRIANAFAQIDVQLRRRHDLVPNLVETAKRYLHHEADTLEAVISARSQAVRATDALRRRPADAAAVRALAGAEQVLEGSLGRLMVLTEAYPELKADETLRALSEELTSTENRVGYARQAFNDEVLAYNDTVGQFPGLLVARLCGFAPAAMLESIQAPEQRQAPRVAL